MLSMFHPRSVNLGSKCLPKVSLAKTSELASNCEFSIEKRSRCLSNGKLLMAHESFITHCSFINRYMRPFVLSMVENDLVTDLACGTSRFCTKSNFLFLYLSHSHKFMVYSFSLKSIS